MKKKNETPAETSSTGQRTSSGPKPRGTAAASSKRTSVRQLELFATDADGRLAAEAWEEVPHSSIERKIPEKQCPKRSSETQRTKRSSEKQRPKQPMGEQRPKRPSKPMPAWLRYLWMSLIVLAFSGTFYYFFIRPYAYRWKPCYGLKAYGICMPYGYQVHGIDISHHQGAIDWTHLQQTRQGPFPIQFVFLKASEGGDYLDPTFLAHFDSARAHGFIRGAYHFYNPKTDPVRQADFFIRTVKLEAGDLPPVLDIEKRGKDEQVLRRDLKIWLDRIEQHYRVKPILYTSYKFKTRYLNDSVFNSYPYWIAHYYVDSVEYRGQWKFWQHTDVGTLPGISEQVDLNLFNGSLDELKQLVIPALEENHCL